MNRSIPPELAQRFMASATDFYRNPVEALFLAWWRDADPAVIAAYSAAIETHPQHGPLAREGWLAPRFALSQLNDCPPGSLGAALRGFIVDHELAEHIAASYHALHAECEEGGALSRMTPALRYKALRGHQLHDLQHVLTGYPPTPLGELAIQAFQLAQMAYPYAALWISTVTTHMALVDPALIGMAMDAISDGWTLGRRADSIQFLRLEALYDEPLETVRARFGLLRDAMPDFATPQAIAPAILQNR